MGKGVLIFVMASSLSLSAMYMSGDENALESAKTEADYQEELLARETATSAYNIVVGKVKRNFDSYRAAYSDLSYGKATYDIGAAEAEDGSITIIAVGKYGNHEYEIIGSVSRSAVAVLDALTITAEISSVTLANSYQISGMDGASSGTNVHGLLTTESTTYNAFMGDADVDQVLGMGGESDVVNGDPYIELANLRSAILDFTGSHRISVTGDQVLGTDDAVGSSIYPKVLVVRGNVRLTDEFAGYGALWVEGDFSMEDDATWNGIVYVAGSESSFKMEDDSRIDGGVVIDGTDSVPPAESLDESDRGLLGGHFDVDVFDGGPSSKEIYHQHQYDDKFDTKGIDLMSAGCKKGGLCWSDVMGSISASEVEIETINSSSTDGTYELKVGSTTYAGNATTPLSLTVDPKDINSFTYTFSTLCALAPSKPSDSQDDTETRNGALSIRISDGSKLIYEVTVYHHAKSGADNSCEDAAPREDATSWVSSSGKDYSGSDNMCVSEDDNDSYTDATERENKWGNRQRKGKSDKSSKKSDKSSKKSDKSSKKSDKSSKKSKKSKDESWYGDTFWANNGECAKTNSNESSESVPMQFEMSDDATIVYNSASLKRLKAMISQMDFSNDKPVARQLVQTTREKESSYTSGDDLQSKEAEARETDSDDSTTKDALKLTAREILVTDSSK